MYLISFTLCSLMYLYETYYLISSLEGKQRLIIFSAEDPSKPWYKHNDTKENNDLARKGFESVFTLMPYRETNFTEVANQSQRGSIYLDSLYDGMLVYAQALQQTLLETGYNKTIYGSQMFYKMMGKTFEGT